MTREEMENRLLDSILAVTSTMTVGKRKAERIVGGRKRLERLHLSGLVECQGKTESQNGKWKYNLAQVLRHCKRAG